MPKVFLCGARLNQARVHDVDRRRELLERMLGNGIIYPYLKTNRRICHCRLVNVTTHTPRSATEIFGSCSWAALSHHSATKCCRLPLVGNYGYAPIKRLRLAWWDWCRSSLLSCFPCRRAM